MAGPPSVIDAMFGNTASNAVNAATVSVFGAGPVPAPVQVPQAAAPNTQQPPTSAPPPAPPAPPPMSPDAAYNGIQDLIGSTAEQNCLNPYFQSTYHWRLVMTGDTDLISQGAASPSGLVSQLLSGGVIIAESGVTGYNIRDVKFATMIAGNQVSQAQSAQTWTVTITEPYGLSFFDAIATAASELQIGNFTKAPFYMVLSFLGYDEGGNFVDNPARNYTTGGRWVWGLTCVDVSVKVTEAGAVYTCTFEPYNALIPMNDAGDILHTPQSFFAIGDTLEELFKDYIDKLNAAWKARYRGELVTFDPIVMRDVSAYFSNPPEAQGKDPSKFKMKPIEAEKNPNRSWEFDNGKYSVNVTPGYSTSNFIIDAIKHTAEGQLLAKNDSKLTAPDNATGSVNSTNVRQSVTFVVEPVVKIVNHDRTSGNYQKRIEFHVSPNYTQDVILTRDQVELAKGEQGRMVSSLIQNGLLRKQYEYLFTSLNTEVLDLDISFTMNQNRLSPNYDGSLMRYDVMHNNFRQHKINRRPDYNENERRQDVPINLVGTSSGGPGVYIEDALDQMGGTGSTPFPYGAPISFWQGNHEAEHAAGTSNFTGMMNRDASITGAVYAQRYNTTGAFTTIQLGIRGDPFWLGQSNMHRQINLISGNVNVASNDLHDHATSNQHCFLHFRYPLRMGDDFKPMLSSSAVFSGIYAVTQVQNTFSDGVFKQELICVKQVLLDFSAWSGASVGSGSASAGNGTGGAGSSPQQSQGTGANPPSSGTTLSGGLPPASAAYTAKASALSQRLQNDLGLTPAQAAGVVGNLSEESRGLTPDINELSGGGGYGLGQWTGARRTNLMNYAQANNMDPTTMDTQYSFLVHELNGPESGALQALRNTNSVTDATTVFQNKYERPNAALAHTDVRLNYANQVANMPAPTDTTTTPSDPPT